MISGIDHLVIAVDDPDEVAASLEDGLGLGAGDGGRHDALGTFNRLVWLGDSYLELIGVFDRDRAAESWIGRPVLASLAAGGGLATWAIAVDDLEGQLRWVPADAGLTAPIDGTRHRPDGRVVRWRLAHPAALSATAPFLIEHDPTGAEWTADERAARAEAAHPAGGPVRLTGIEVQTDRPAAAAARLRSLLATSAEADGRGAVRVQLGAQHVRFVTPRLTDAAPAIVELVVDAPMRRRVARIGDCEIRLRGGSAAHRNVGNPV